MKKCAILFLLPVVSALGAGSPFQVSLLDNNILHVQTSDVGSNFTKQLEVAAPTNAISGTILDLRFADGGNASAMGYFVGQKTPLVILVNSETRGAAATLAEQLRSAHKGIVMGSMNSASAITPDIGVTVAAGDERKFQENPFAQLSAGPPPTRPSSNAFLPFIDHTSEADLVRKRVKDGDQDDSASARTEPDQPVIRDPALARAVDLLKALAILKQSRG